MFLQTHASKRKSYLALLRGSDTRKEPQVGSQEAWVSSLCLNRLAV